MHNLELTEDQDLIVDTARKFVADAVAPNVLEQDEHRKFARAEFDGLAELGLFGLSVGEDAGGAGMGFVPFVAALEAIGQQSGSLARLFVGQVQCALALEAAGHAALDEVMSGSALAVFVGPEHGIAFAADKVDGVAELVPGGGEAGVFYVAARDGETWKLVAVDAGGVERTAVRSLGLASSAPARVTFAAASATVVAEGDVAERAIDRARAAAWLGVAATAVGGGVACIEAAKKHAGERIAFGKPLLRQEAVVRKIVESRQGVDAARQLAMHAARLADAGLDATQSALQARVLAVDAMVRAADEAIQIHGGFGYTVEYHVERHYRDGKTLEVLDGGSESLRDRLAAAEV
ncbi:MAG: acyl-CoA/acyl-ACP dehydrogenase [Planctomycetes bacterium]|nr:acyl-CoA/acyl-ACP dehydrogenase [Planctomycetota bacterium]